MEAKDSLENKIYSFLPNNLFSTNLFFLLLQLIILIVCMYVFYSCNKKLIKFHRCIRNLCFLKIRKLIKSY